MRPFLSAAASAALTLFVSAIPASADVPDQASSCNSLAGSNISLMDPVGQTFQPAQSQLDAVEFFFGGYGTGMGTVTLNVREDDFDGGIVGTETINVSMTFDVDQQVRFEFDPPLTLTVDDTYMLELVTASDDIGLLTACSYDRGTMWINGEPFGADTSFRTYGPCGNDTVDLGEECDDGTFECCDFHTCQLSSTATACEFDSNECTNDHCDGAGTCVTENFAIDTPCTQDGDPCVVEACNGSGACVSLNDAEAGAPCDAGDSLCTNDACDGSGTCVADAAPDATCSSAATAGLVMIDSSKPGKDKVKFKWKKGPEDFTGIGEPEEDTTYALCIYDDGAIVADGNLPGGSWTDKGAKLQYKDKEGTIDSVTGGLLVFGFDQFSASMSLGGASLALNLGSTVGDSLIAQIRTSTGGCFGAEFSGEEIKKSTESKFVGVEKN